MWKSNFSFGAVALLSFIKRQEAKFSLNGLFLCLTQSSQQYYSFINLPAFQYFTNRNNPFRHHSLFYWHDANPHCWKWPSRHQKGPVIFTVADKSLCSSIAVGVEFSFVKNVALTSIIRSLLMVGSTHSSFWPPSPAEILKLASNHQDILKEIDYCQYVNSEFPYKIHWHKSKKLWLINVKTKLTTIEKKGLLWVSSAKDLRTEVCPSLCFMSTTDKAVHKEIVCERCWTDFTKIKLVNMWSYQT